MFTFLIILIGIIALLLTGVVLLQSGKGGGLAGIASGGATQQVLGARQAPDVLEKVTWSLATVFIVLCLLTSFAIPRGDGPSESVIQQRAQDEATEQPAPVLPPAPDGQQQQQVPPAAPGQQQPAPGQQQPAPQD